MEIDHSKLEETALSYLWMPTQDWTELAEDGITVMTEAKGVHIKDSKGNWGFDGVAGLMLVNVGHGRQEIVDAISAQLNTLHYANTFKFPAAPTIKFAEKIASLTPGNLNRTYFTSGGSEAVETALKIAYRYHYNRNEPQRKKFIGREGSYHGTTRGALSVSTSSYLDRPSYSEILPDNFIMAPQPYYYRRNNAALTHSEFSIDCAKAIENIILEEGPETIAGVIAEPVSFSAGVAVPSNDYWPMLREICDRYGVLLIADEVITGWGRTGKWFAVDHWEVTPDIMTMAKGITSGYFPVGACVVTDSVFEYFKGDTDKTYRHGITYGGHPGGAAAGLANVAIMEREGLIENSAKMGQLMLDQLNALVDHPTVGDIRGLGLMCAVELVSDKETKEPLSDNSKAIKLLNQKMTEGGLYTRANRQVFFAPPLSVTESDITQMVQIFAESLSATEHSLGLG
jgi:adenosylmethionine-8-amino-7-oxononanoate aminotransferase